MVGSVHAPNRDASKCPNVTQAGTAGWGDRIKPGSSFRSLAPCTVSRLGKERESRVWRTMSSDAGPIPPASNRGFACNLSTRLLFPDGV